MNFKEAIKNIRDRIRLEDVVDEYATPSRYDNVQRWYKCPFPDHDDSTPSFIVNTERQTYKCFGCDRRGDVFNFLMEMENISFIDAVKNIAKRVGVDFKSENITDNDNHKSNNELYKIYVDATVYYHNTLKSEKGKFGQEYIKKRHLTDETVLKFAIGYAPGEALYLYNHLKELGYNDSIINESGLVNFSEKGKSDFLYDARVIFPITDEYNRVIAIDGRTIGSSDQKYKNSKDSTIFKKSENLFGLQYARKTEKDFFIMCEGNIDCISLHQAGYDNTIAILGTALSDIQVNKIKKYVNKVYLALDNDSAGIKALKKHAPILIKNKISVYTIDLSPVKDPDEFINSYGKGEFDNRVNNAKEYVVSLVDLLKKEYNLEDSVQYEDYLDELALALSLYSSSAIRYKQIINVSKALSSATSEQEILVNDLSGRIVKILKTNDEKAILAKNNENSTDKNELNNQSENRVNKTEFGFIINLIDGVFNDYKVNLKNILFVDDFTDNEIKYIYKEIINNKNINDIINELNDDNSIVENKDKVLKILYYENIKAFIINTTNNDNADEKTLIIKNSLIDYIKKIKINSLEKKKINAEFSELVKIQNDINDLIKKPIDL